MPVSAVERAKAHSKNAALASLDGNLDKALGELILASELYVEAVEQAANDAPLRQKLRELCDETVGEAEKIKERQQTPDAAFDTFRRPGEPARTETGSYVRQPMRTFQHSYMTSRLIPKREQVLLLQSSKLQETICPIWNEDHIERAMHCLEPFQTSISWSATRLAKYECKEARLVELIKHPLFDSTDCVLYPTFRQNVLDDCSFVCALIVADQWSVRFRTELLTAQLFPRDKSGHCIMSTMGKYMAKVWLHGSDRQAVVDDRLPAPDSGSMHDLLLFSQAYKDVVWPALLEKVYYTIKGCSFEGSNSASDLYLLTGWLPEEIHLRSTGFDLDHIWEKLFHAWKIGQVLITTGSPRMTTVEEVDHALTSNHSYAVIGMRMEADGTRLLNLQDPWCGSDTSVDGNNFDVDFGKVSLLFGALFLSWDPRLWRYRELYHVRRDIGFDTKAPICLYDYPQLVMANESDTDVETLIVLSRHGQSEHCHIGMALFANNGYRQWCDQDSVTSTDHLTSTGITLRATLPARCQYTLVLFQSWLEKPITYTVAVHHNEKAPVIQLRDALRQHYRSEDFHVFKGAWTATTAGGNANHSSFVKNPQFTVTINEHSDFYCALEADSDVNVHVDLVMLPQESSRIANTRGKQCVASSKAYQRTSTSSLARGLPPSRYALVCSTWKPGEVSNFKLTGLLKPAGSTDWRDSELLPTWSAIDPLGYGKSHHHISARLSAERVTSTISFTSPAANNASVYVHSILSRVFLRVNLASTGAIRKQIAMVAGETSLVLEPVKLGSLPVDSHYELTITAGIATGARNIAFELDVYATQPLIKFELQ